MLSLNDFAAVAPVGATIGHAAALPRAAMNARRLIHPSRKER